jgi:hypothetical protein
MADRFAFARRRPGSAGSPERPVDVFVRGLLSGAVVGAVVAGSAIWERRHRQRQAAEAAGAAEAGIGAATANAGSPSEETAAG